VRKNVLCCIALLLASPVFATITKQQSAALWNQTSTMTCAQPFGSSTGAGNLIVVWTSWQSTSTFTASVKDSFPTKDIFVSAVGPTLQSMASTPTTAQIFYAPSINGGSDTVTVTYSGTVSSANCVIVEYSGLDTLYPLDSVSSGYSYSGGSYMDSGTAAPANANLLVFGGGTSDTTATVVAESGFTSIQSNPGSITEQFINSSTSPNNTLQRATACLSALSPCPTTGVGDWVMQMAVFRDASWAVGGGWSPARPPQVINAAQYPGVDPCAQLVAAETNSQGADIVLPIQGGGQTTPTPCSVDPLSGFSSAGRVTITNVGNGNSTVLAVNAPIHINTSQTLQAPAGHATESSGVMIAPSTTFASLAAQRL
jgi:hypothetical protein